MLYYNLEDESNYISVSDVGYLKAIYYGPDIAQKDRCELHGMAVKRVKVV